LVLLESFIVGFFDFKAFKKANRKKAAKQAKYISLTGAFLAIVLFLINVFI
jgi:hypothetical protein